MTVDKRQIAIYFVQKIIIHIQCVVVIIAEKFFMNFPLHAGDAGRYFVPIITCRKIMIVFLIIAIHTGLTTNTAGTAIACWTWNPTDAVIAERSFAIPAGSRKITIAR
jgi:hypothetical protein